MGHRTASRVLSSPWWNLVDPVKKWADGWGLGYWAISGEQQNKGVLVDILGQFIEDTLEVSGDINAPFLEGVEDCHQDPSGMGTRIGLGSEAGLACDHGGAKIALGQVVFCRHLSTIRPVIHSLCLFSEDVLDALDPQVGGRSVDGMDDLGFELSGLERKLSV